MAKTVKVAIPDSVIDEISRNKIKQLEKENSKLRGQLAQYGKLANEKEAILKAKQVLRDALDKLDELVC